MKRLLTLCILTVALAACVPQTVFAQAVTDDGTTAIGIGSQAGQPLTLNQCFQTGNCSVEHIFILSNNLIRWIVGIAGALALFMYVVGGLWMIMSAGSSTRINRGKEILIGTTIALFFMLSSWLIVNFVLQSLGSKDFQITGNQCAASGDCSSGQVCYQQRCVEPCYTRKQLAEPADSTKRWSCTTPDNCGIADVSS